MKSYDVMADGQVVARIMMFADASAGKPWIWTRYEPNREPLLGWLSGVGIGASFVTRARFEVHQRAS